MKKNLITMIDVGLLWQNELKNETDIDWLHQLYENKVFARSKERALLAIHDMILARITELEKAI